METLKTPVAPLKGRDSYNPARMNKNITIAFDPPSAEQLEAWMTSTNGSEESLPKPTTVLFVTMLWLPGSAQCPDNELIRRVCNALQVAMNNQIETTTMMTPQTQLVWIEKVVCSTYKDAPTLLGQLQREVVLKQHQYQQQRSAADADAAAPHRVLHRMVIGGHSLGAGTAAKIACQTANATTKTTTAAAGTLPHNKWCVPCIMMGAQPPPTRQRWNTLTILGENDGGSQLLRTLAAGGKKTAVVGVEATDKKPKTFVVSTTTKEAQNAPCKNERETAEIGVQPESSAATVFVDTIIVPKDGDHSLRVRAHGNHDKEGASTTRETCAMNLEVADAMLQFMGASHCEL